MRVRTCEVYRNLIEKQYMYTVYLERTTSR